MLTSRRSFFLGAATAFEAVRVLGANDRVRVGIVGLGGRGGAHITDCQSAGGSDVVGLCDVDQTSRERAQAKLAKLSLPKAREFADMRRMFDDKEIDAVTVATPNHWHALATIWACEAGKDVYVEKPASHNVYEGWRMAQAAKTHGRMVQVGCQSRSLPHIMRAMQLLREGVIGKVYLAKGLCYKRRKSIGRTPVEPVPPGVDWNLFRGPAPMVPFTQNQFKYNWHWFWDTGNGDLGNQGVHQMDICLWGLGDPGMPRSVVSTGGKFVYDDDQETPNTQLATCEYGDAQIVFEVRGLLTGPEAGFPPGASTCIGNLFYGADGWMWVDSKRFTVYKGESNEKAMEQTGLGSEAVPRHFRNFFKACRSRKPETLTAGLEIGITSAALCHLANISYRTRTRLEWDKGRQRFLSHAAADRLLTRQYRKPFVV